MNRFILLLTIILITISGCNPVSVSDNNQPIEVESAIGPLEPINPGGPIVEITLKNVSDEPVVSLTATLEQFRLFEFIFDVTTSNPLLPGDSISSRKTLITKIGNKTVNESIFALENMLKNYPKDLRVSITYDNGSENAGHERLNEIIGIKSYFCAPYSSWEKGSVENRNGIIRRFFPKKTDFAKVENDRIKKVERWINNRPMKCLGFQTPAEVFNGFVALAP